MAVNHTLYQNSERLFCSAPIYDSTVTIDLPPELWERILLKLYSTKDLKNISLVCHLFRTIVLKPLWNTPVLKKGISLHDLRGLKHLPIECIDGNDIGQIDDVDDSVILLKQQEYVYVLCSFPHLKSLNLGWNFVLDHKMLGRIAKMKNLRSLSMQRFYNGNDPVAFKQLASLDTLESLYMNQQDKYLDDEIVLGTVSQIKSLRALKVCLTDSTCHYLTQLPYLEELTVYNSNISEVSYKVLLKIHTLKRLCFLMCYDVNGYVDVIRTSKPSLIIGKNYMKMYQVEDKW